MYNYGPQSFLNTCEYDTQISNFKRVVISGRERKEIGMGLCNTCNYLFLKEKNIIS